MVLAHTARVVPATSALGVSVRDAIHAAEPCVSAAFLFLVGWGLSLSWVMRSRALEGADDHSQQSLWRDWYIRALRKAGALYLSGAALFVLQHGVAVPDLWASPDILGTIAWAIVVVGALERHRSSVLLWGGALTLALAAALESSGLAIVGVNGGAGGVVPLLAFGFAGAWWGRSGSRFSSGARLGIAAGAVALAAGALALPLGLTRAYPSVLTSTSGAVTRVWFWNHTVAGVFVFGAPVVLGALVVASAQHALVGARPQSATDRWLAPLELLGRHALVCYVGHLCVLGGLEWLGLVPAGLPGLAAVTGSLLMVLVLVAMLLESARARALRIGAYRFGVPL
jgi:hypothetical protein